MTQIDPTYVVLRRFETIDPENFASVNNTLQELHEAAFIDGETVAQQQEPINDGLGVRIGRAVLYHGSGTPSIAEFLPAEDMTIGKGFYATSQPDAAALYAYGRARNGGSPHLYVAGLKDMQFVDLRTQENMGRFVPGFASVLEAELRAISNGTSSIKPEMQWLMQNIILEKLDLIRSGLQNNHPKDVLMQLGNTFSRFVAANGYDGIVSFEGGEFAEQLHHDSWVIIEPSKLAVRQVLELPQFVTEREPTPEEKQELAREEAKRQEAYARFGDPIPPYTSWDQIAALKAARSGKTSAM